jgi:hypothetical protein
MKKLSLFIIILIIFSSCIVSDKSYKELVTQNKKLQSNIDYLEEKDFIFKKNQECFNHKKSIQNNLKNNSLQSIENIFYSPKVNSCLWVRIVYVQNKDEQVVIKRRELFDVLYYMEAQTPVKICNEGFGGIPLSLNEKYYVNKYPCSEFYEFIEEYKLFDSKNGDMKNNT